MPVAKSSKPSNKPSSRSRAAKKKNLIVSAVIGGTLLVVGLVAAVFLVSKSQDLRQQASTGCEPYCTISPTPTLGQCQNDGDCPLYNQSCVNNSCLTIDTSKPCLRGASAFCAGGDELKVCEDGHWSTVVCEKGCNRAAGSCGGAPTPTGKGCQTTANCQFYGQSCISNRCQTVDTNKPCVASDQPFCTGGDERKVCQNGRWTASTCEKGCNYANGRCGEEPIPTAVRNTSPTPAPYVDGCPQKTCRYGYACFSDGACHFILGNPAATPTPRPSVSPTPTWVPISGPRPTFFPTSTPRPTFLVTPTPRPTFIISPTPPPQLSEGGDCLANSQCQTPLTCNISQGAAIRNAGKYLLWSQMNKIRPIPKFPYEYGQCVSGRGSAEK